jgi:hypothetical protein
MKGKVKMPPRFLLIVAALLAVWGCATPKPLSYKFPAGTRVGIINYLEPYATHQNLSVLVIGSFTKTLSVDWNIPAFIEDQLTRRLQKDSRYTVIAINFPEPPGGQNQSESISAQISLSGEITSEAAKLLEELAEKYNLDVIIVIKSFRGPGPFKTGGNQPIEFQGYGLFTKELFLYKKAYAYANIAVMVYKTNPITYIDSGTPKIKSSALGNFDLPGDLRNLPPSDLNKLQPIIQRYAEQAVIKALDQADLISSSPLSIIPHQLRKSDQTFSLKLSRHGSPG